MRRNRLWWILPPACVIGVLVVAATLSADKAPSTEGTEKTLAPPAPNATEKLSPEAAAILDIRQRVGESLLSGTMLEQDDAGAVQADFVEALREASASEPLTLDEPQASVQKLQDASMLRSPVPLEASLVEASIQLDREALRLESQHQFERAEKLRKLSKRVRKQIQALVEQDN